MARREARVAALALRRQAWTALASVSPEPGALVHSLQPCATLAPIAESTSASSLWVAGCGTGVLEPQNMFASFLAAPGLQTPSLCERLLRQRLEIRVLDVAQECDDPLRRDVEAEELEDHSKHLRADLDARAVSELQQFGEVTLGLHRTSRAERGRCRAMGRAFCRSPQPQLGRAGAMKSIQDS